MGGHQADVAEQGARRASCGRSTCPQRHLPGADHGRTCCRSTVLPNLTAEDLKETQVRRHSSGSTTSLLRCVLIIREPSELLFFSHGRTLTPSRACSKPREFNSRPASTTADRSN